MKLWEKSTSVSSHQTHVFTTGRDPEFDLLLAPFDVLGCRAHVAMLGEVGLLSEEETCIALEGLARISQEIEEGTFQMEEGMEDVHSQIEALLTRRVGEVGKKIHTGRSRNDQVLTAIKLFLKSEIHSIRKEVQVLFDTLLDQAHRGKDAGIPGYTHFQVAMPSSVGLWLSAYAESLVDDLEMLLAAYRIADKNPLGSAAGYGSSFPLNRRSTTEKLGFRTLNWNSQYAQMTRGKTEKAVAMALSTLAATLSRLAADAIWYQSADLGFVRFDESFTTGSSLMPHKKNPDVLELIRGRCNRIQSIPNEFALLMANLPSGYHRDMQLTKEILFPALVEFRECLAMMNQVMQTLEPVPGILKQEKYALLYTVDALNEKVRSGLPFRDAYRQIGEEVGEGRFSIPAHPVVHTHEGSTGNLCLDEIRREMDQVQACFS